MTAVRLTLACAAVLLATAPAVAHHSSAGIDRTKTVTLKGTVKRFAWTNPHSWMEVEVRGEDGAVVTWQLEMTSPAYLVRAGWKSSTLKPGDEVQVVARPLQNGDPGGLFVSVTLADGQTLGERRVTSPPPPTRN